MKEQSCNRLFKKQNLSIKGPFPADTIFMKHLRKNFDVIIGIPRQVLPVKSFSWFRGNKYYFGVTIYKISPDHGPNYNMIGANKSNANSLINAIKF